MSNGSGSWTSGGTDTSSGPSGRPGCGWGGTATGRSIRGCRETGHDTGYTDGSTTPGATPDETKYPSTALCRLSGNPSCTIHVPPRGPPGPPPLRVFTTSTSGPASAPSFPPLFSRRPRCRRARPGVLGLLTLKLESDPSYLYPITALLVHLFLLRCISSSLSSWSANSHLRRFPHAPDTHLFPWGAPEVKRGSEVGAGDERLTRVQEGRWSSGRSERGRGKALVDTRWKKGV